MTSPMLFYSRMKQQRHHYQAQRKEASDRLRAYRMSGSARDLMHVRQLKQREEELRQKEETSKALNRRNRFTIGSFKMKLGRSIRKQPLVASRNPLFGTKSGTVMVLPYEIKLPEDTQEGGRPATLTANDDEAGEEAGKEDGAPQQGAMEKAEEGNEGVQTEDREAGEVAAQGETDSDVVDDADIDYAAVEEAERSMNTAEEKEEEGEPQAKAKVEERGESSEDAVEGEAGTEEEEEIGRLEAGPASGEGEDALKPGRTNGSGKAAVRVEGEDGDAAEGGSVRCEEEKQAVMVEA